MARDKIIYRYGINLQMRRIHIWPLDVFTSLYGRLSDAGCLGDSSFGFSTLSIRAPWAESTPATRKVLYYTVNSRIFCRWSVCRSIDMAYTLCVARIHNARIRGSLQAKPLAQLCHGQVHKCFRQFEIGKRKWLKMHFFARKNFISMFSGLFIEMPIWIEKKAFAGFTSGLFHLVVRLSATFDGFRAQYYFAPTNSVY